MSKTSQVSVIVPSIPPRADMLGRALSSVTKQTLLPRDVHVRVDWLKQGAPHVRTALLNMVRTPYVAPLDDDDEIYPDHLELLVNAMEVSGADLVYPWFDVGSGGTDPFPQFEDVPWDDTHPHQIPVTMIARTESLLQCGGWLAEWDDTQGEDPGIDELGNRSGEDYRLILRMVNAGMRIVHLPVRTWRWHHHESNTSGLPSRWPTIEGAT